MVKKLKKKKKKEKNINTNEKLNLSKIQKKIISFVQKNNSLFNQ